MKCPRCGGFMLRNEFRQWGKIYPYFNCVHCGELIDKIILENRTEALQGKKPIKKTKPRFHWT